MFLSKRECDEECEIWPPTVLVFHSQSHSVPLPPWVVITPVTLLCMCVYVQFYDFVDLLLFVTHGH